MKRYDVFAIGSSYDGSAYTEECEYSDGKYVLYSDVAPLVEAAREVTEAFRAIGNDRTIITPPGLVKRAEDAMVGLNAALTTIDAQERGV